MWTSDNTRHRRPPWCTRWLQSFQHRKLQMSPWVEIQAIEFRQIFQHKPKGSALQTFQGRTRRETGEDEQQAKDKIAEHCQTCEHGNPLNMNSQRENSEWGTTPVGVAAKKSFSWQKVPLRPKMLTCYNIFADHFPKRAGECGFCAQITPNHTTHTPSNLGSHLVWEYWLFNHFDITATRFRMYSILLYLFLHTCVHISLNERSDETGRGPTQWSEH